MKVRAFTVGMFLTNCYLVTCEKTGEAIIVDPGFASLAEADGIFRLVEHTSLELRFVVNTHGHPDHTCGNGLALERYHVPILIHERDASMLGESGRRNFEFFGFANSSPNADRLLRDGDSVNFGKVTLKVMHTPGHSPGSVCLIGATEVFTGDTLFQGSIGRTDLPGSSESNMIRSLKRLESLPDNLRLYPGHGLQTTVGTEKRQNPFLQ